MIVFSNQILLDFSLYVLRCIILTISKQIIAFKKGTFAPPAPSTERQEGRLLPPAPLSGVPVCDRTLNRQVNHVHERALRFAYNDCKNDFGSLLGQSNSMSIHVRNLQLLIMEIFKTKFD